jgi:hypothetical protein
MNGIINIVFYSTEIKRFVSINPRNDKSRTLSLNLELDKNNKMVSKILNCSTAPSSKPSADTQTAQSQNQCDEYKHVFVNGL